MPTLKLRQDNVRTVPYQGHGGKHQCVYWDEARKRRLKAVLIWQMDWEGRDHWVH